MHMDSWVGSEQGIKLCEDKQKIPWSADQDSPPSFSMEWGFISHCLCPHPSSPQKAQRERRRTARKEPGKQEKLKIQAKTTETHTDTTQSETLGEVTPRIDAKRARNGFCPRVSPKSQPQTGQSQPRGGTARVPGVPAWSIPAGMERDRAGWSGRERDRTGWSWMERDDGAGWMERDKAG